MLTIGLLIASSASVALLAGMPMYADGVLQRLLMRDLERHQATTNRYPGRAVVEVDLYRLRNRLARPAYVDEVTEQLEARLVPRVGVPVAAQMRQLSMDYLYAERPAVQTLRHAADGGIFPPRSRKILGRVEALEHLADHASITHGRMFAAERDGALYEAMVTGQAYRELELALGDTYQLRDLLGDAPRIEVRVVGIFDAADHRDLYWFGRVRELESSFLIDFSLFERDFLATESRNLTRSIWHYAFDYHQVRIDNVGAILRRYQDYSRLSAAPEIRFSFAIAPLLEDYERRATALRRTLLFLQPPAALLLFVLIVMLAQLVVDGDRAEIATLKGRGAPSKQLSLGYLLEAAILALAGILLGVPLGIGVMRVLGATNGFLEFVARPAIPLVLSARMLLFAAAGAMVFLGAMLAPLARATGVSIVGFKSKRSQDTRKPWWQRYFFDLLLLSVAVYVRLAFPQRRQLAALAPDLLPPLDPLVFLSASAFVVGAVLLAMRFFPVSVRVIFRLGRARWTPATYAGFLHVSRSRGREQFLMAFLALTLGLGLYSSTVARTINQNAADAVVYAFGADLVLVPEFPGDASVVGGQTDGAGDGNDVGAAATGAGAVTDNRSLRYVAPPLEPFATLPGVTTATRVFVRSGAQMVLPTRRSIVADVMALTAHEFGQASSLRHDLLPIHWFHYLNALSAHPQAALVSASARDVHDVRLGDSLLLTWRGQVPVEVVVYGFIDFWPTFDPLAPAGRHGPQVLAVTNYDYVFAKMATEPHEIWLDLAAGASSSDLYAAIEARQLPLREVRDVAQQLIVIRNDPLLQGTNGVLTFGFISAVSVTITGYLLFWAFALRSRTLQLGLMRAIGISRRQVAGMLVVEQLLAAGFAASVGIAVGQLAALLFAPLLQLAGSGAGQALPFQIVALRSDYLRFYGLVLLLLAAGAGMFWVLLRRMRVPEALKLGEE